MRVTHAIHAPRNPRGGAGGALSSSTDGGANRRDRYGRLHRALAALLAAAPLAASADVLYKSDDLTIHWDNSFKYTAGFRLGDPHDALIDSLPGSLNQDDGDRNFDTGLISNRLDLLSEFDLRYKDSGFRISGAGWYDTVYRSGTDNDSPATSNAIPHDEFPEATRQLHGRDAELLDAFVYTRQTIGGKPVTVKAGRYAQLWGETLFFGANGIAGGQAPIDVVKAFSVPGTTFKELIRPTGKVGAQVQLSSTLSIAGYYEFEWERTRVPGAGSYFSPADVLDEGGDVFYAGAPPAAGLPPPAFYRGRDFEGSDTGQGGVQVRFAAANIDFGLYAIRYNDKDFQAYLVPDGGYDPATGSIGDYMLVYHDGVKAYGASFSTTWDTLNLAGEVSVRRNAALVSDPQIAGPTADNDDNPAYAVGNAALANLSAMWTMPINPLFKEGTLMAEVAWNRRTSIDKNPQAIAANSDRDAWGFRVLMTPTYRQALPGVDLSIPIGLGYSPKGRSSVVPLFNNGGVDKGGDFSIGVSGAYLDVWRFGITYSRYFGDKAGTFLNGAGQYSYDQWLSDRDFVAITFGRTL